MLWRLSRPVLGLALLSGACLLTALVVIRLVEPDSAAAAPIGGIASILSGVALIGLILALIEFLLAARAFVSWTAGKGKRCPGCGWPMSPSLILPDRCLNPRHEADSQE